MPIKYSRNLLSLPFCLSFCATTTKARATYKAEVASILGCNTLANIKKKLLTKILMSSREFPTEWGVDSKRNVMQYATEQCKQKCGCSKVVCKQKGAHVVRSSSHGDLRITTMRVLSKKVHTLPTLLGENYRGTLLETSHNLSEILVIRKSSRNSAVYQTCQKKCTSSGFEMLSPKEYDKGNSVVSTSSV